MITFEGTKMYPDPFSSAKSGMWVKTSIGEMSPAITTSLDAEKLVKL